MPSWTLRSRRASHSGQGRYGVVVEVEKCITLRVPGSVHVISTVLAGPAFRTIGSSASACSGMTFIAVEPTPL
jgi:hypothetical protein